MFVSRLPSSKMTEPIAPDAWLRGGNTFREPLQARDEAADDHNRHDAPKPLISADDPWPRDDKGRPRDSFSEYVELHAHSAFSFHDGTSQPHELAARAAELGYAGFALTDHDGVYGAMEFAQAAAPLGLKAIVGAELTLDDNHHLTMLAQDARGWANLCRLLTMAHAGTRKHSARANGIAPQEQPQVPLEAVLEHAEGLVCLSGCAARGAVGGRVARGDHAGAEQVARRLRDAFTPERLRIELQRPLARHDRAHCNALTELARRLGLRTVATGNVHAHSRKRAYLQDVFVALREGATLDETEPARRGNFSHVMASPAELAARFAEHPEAVRETLAVAERIEFDLTRHLGYRYPHAGDPAAHERLTQICRERLTTRYGDDVPAHLRGSVGRRRVALREARQRLDDELAIIGKLGLGGFFLIHHELLEMAREIAVQVRGASAARRLLPPGRGRGSSVASIVCYLTGLSHVDPLEAELCLGRFLNEDLQSLPDIDLDFPRDIRAELIPRVHERYGHERSALVAAFSCYRTRGALRDLGKALGLPVGEIERLIRATDRHLGETVGERVREGLRRSPGGERLLESPRWRALIGLLPEIHRLPRHISQHPGGMVIATQPLIEQCPVQPAAMAQRQFVQWDKDSCADAGFVKIDLLGLGMLSAVERTVDLIADARGEQVDLSRIPLDDEAVFEDIRRADTTGVFQIESRAQMQMLVRSRPEDLNDLIVQVAIVRPGPIIGGAVHLYLERRKLLRADPSYEVPYEHPLLEPVLKDTLGAIVFQDQVLEVATALAGFTPGEAEGLRRAMSRKRSYEGLDFYRQRFVDGAAARGVDGEVAERVFEQILGFSGFGFPKAHAAAFGLLAYQTSWLRHHYGPEFVCGLLNEQPMGFYPPDALVHEAQRRGIPVLPVDVSASGAECSVEWVEIASREGGIATKEGEGTVSLTRPQCHGSAELPTRGKNLAWPSGVLPTRGPRVGRTGLGGAIGGERDGSLGDGERVNASICQRPAGVPDVGRFLAYPSGDLPDVGPTSGNKTLAIRIGLGYVKGIREDSVRALVAARNDDGGFESVSDLAARSGADGSTLEKLAWAGACDALGPGGRREALWTLGAAPTGEPVGEAGAQLALPLEPMPAPELRRMSRWQTLLADYGATGLTVGEHPLSMLRERLREQLGERLIAAANLHRLKEGTRVSVAGLVVARQRPGTAKGVVFVLLEDETGTVNVVLPPPVYDEYRAVARSEPLLLVDGRLELRTGAVNVLARSLRAIEPFDSAQTAACVRQLRTAQGEGEDERKDRRGVADIRAVAPVGLNFGRRGR